MVDYFLDIDLSTQPPYTRAFHASSTLLPGMRDNNNSSPTTSTRSTSGRSPRLLRSSSKTHPTMQVSSVDGAEQASVSWMSKQKATAIEHFVTKLTHRTPRAGAATASYDDPVEWSPQTPQAAQTPIVTRTNDRDVDSVQVPDDLNKQSSEHVVANPFTKKMQDIFSSFPSFSPRLNPGSLHPTPSASSPAETYDTPASAQDSHLLSPLSLSPSPPGGSSPLQGWQPLWSALDRLRSPSSKNAELPRSPEPPQDRVLDCIDDNNSIMMYGPLEPDETSEVEIACSEIVSINGDGEEIRTPQPRYVPLPTESFDEVVVASPARSPLSRFVPLPFDSIDQVLGARSPLARFSPLPSEPGSGALSPQPSFASFPMQSIDQVLTGGGEGLPNSRRREADSESVSETTTAVQLSPTAGPGDLPPVKEYRVWLPSLTKISVQTMWWGFRIYLPPPVLDVLNNRQLEAVKRAAIITTALQWLMEHLPIALLPPQVRPGVTVLRHLVPYVGYIGGFIAWSWSAIRSFDKGFGVVLTATWLLPFVLIPGTWEATEMPNVNVNPDRQSSSSTS